MLPPRQKLETTGMSTTARKRFSEETLREVEKVLSSYPVKESAVLPLLHIAQREFGSVDRDAVALVAETAGVTPARVAQTMSFYTMLSPVPQGKHVIEVCNNISCSLLGSETILEHLERRLGVKRGATRPDGLVTLKSVECLGSCGTAPVMIVNDKYHENLTVDKVESILKELGL